jgi:dienelactone hydrolase
VIARAFHRWEQRLASIDTNRVVRPFEWGLEWLGLDGRADGPPGNPDDDALSRLLAWSRATMADTDAFYRADPTTAYEHAGDRLTFPSAIVTPDAVNNVVHARVFPAETRDARTRRAVLVLPQWNSDAGGHVGLCRLLARFGVTAIRLSLPYHDARKPADLARADFIVSANVGRTVQINRQAVLDARRVIDWLEGQGYERIGILGTSLGSCLSMLTMAHDTRIRAGVFNHVSPYFADVVWHGLSTRHVRAGLEGHITLDDLRACWMPISPWPFIDRVQGRAVRLIYARYDLTFPVDLSRQYVAEFARREVPADIAILPCGHYTTGKAPFKFLDGFYLIKYLVNRL